MPVVPSRSARIRAPATRRAARGALQPDGPPGPDGIEGGAPARHVADQRRAQQPQPLVVDHARLPAGARSLQAVEMGVEAAEGDRERLAARKRQRDLARREHRVDVSTSRSPT